MFMKPTVCMKCNKNLATVKLTRIVKGKVNVLNLCKDCAGEISPYQKKLNDMQSNLSDILNKLIGGAEEEKPEPETPHEEKIAQKVIKATCKECGLEYSTYRESLYLGCPGCYHSFERYLIPDLRRLHGSTTHKGKVPPQFVERYKHIQTINDLQAQLEKYIESEDFEQAASIRDKIKSLKNDTEIR